MRGGSQETVAGFELDDQINQIEEDDLKDRSTKRVKGGERPFNPRSSLPPIYDDQENNGVENIRMFHIENASYEDVVTCENKRKRCFQSGKWGNQRSFILAILIEKIEIGRFILVIVEMIEIGYSYYSYLSRRKYMYGCASNIMNEY